MNTTIHNIDIGDDLDCEGILAALADRKEELEAIILPDMTMHDMRAVYCDGSLDLENVYQLDDGAYYLSFTYDWYAHHQCKDGTRGDTAIEDMKFEYSNGLVTFRIAEIEPRTTEDEL